MGYFIRIISVLLAVIACIWDVAAVDLTSGNLNQEIRSKYFGHEGFERRGKLTESTPARLRCTSTMGSWCMDYLEQKAGAVLEAVYLYYCSFYCGPVQLPGVSLFFVFSPCLGSQLRWETVFAPRTAILSATAMPTAGCASALLDGLE